MKNIIAKISLVVFAATVLSCGEKGAPNYEYFPNMYDSVAYEAYESEADNTVLDNGLEAMLPATGTISRGLSVYDYENSEEGYASAKANLRNTLPTTTESLENGKAMYGIYCAVCHGEKGDGVGILAKREKILGVPAYNDAGRAITEGSIYHVIYYGRNGMGSYAGQINDEERWHVVQYVMALKADLDGVERPPLDSEEVELDIMTEGDETPMAVVIEESH